MKWTHIIIHHTAGADHDGRLVTPAIRDYHVTQRGWKDIGYHAIVEQYHGSYEAIFGRPTNQMGAHAQGWNSYSLGLAFVGNYMDEPPDDDMLVVACNRVILPWMVAFNIPHENILPHRGTKATACPGDSFDMDRLKGILRGDH